MRSGERNDEGIFALDTFQDCCALVVVVIFCAVAGFGLDTLTAVVLAARMLP